MPLFIKDGKSPIDATNVSPSPTSWGKNTETLAADKVLTDASETLQFLNPNGTDRIVALPALSAANPFFFVYNSGTAGRLTIRDSAAVLVSDVEPGGVAWLFSDGATWASQEFGVRTAGVFAEAVFFGRDTDFGGNQLAVLRPASTQGLSGANQTTGLLVNDGNIERVSWNLQQTGTRRWSLSVGGTSYKFWTVGTEGTTQFSPPIVAREGDTVTITQDLLAAGTNDAGRTGMVLVNRIATAGYSLYFGGDCIENGDFLLANGRTDAPMDSTITPEEEHTIIGSVTATKMGVVAENLELDTDFYIYKNGIQSELVTTWARTVAERAVQPTSTAFAEGDTVAVEYSDGGGFINDALNTRIHLFCEGETGIVYPFGGSLWQPGFFLSANGSFATGGASATLDEGYEQPVAFSGTAVKLSLRSSNVPASDIELWKNGVMSEGVALSATTDVGALNTALIAGDRISLKSIGNLGDSLALVQVK